MMHLDKFFCIEGIDGVGKTTLIHLLSEYLPYLKIGCEPTYEGEGALVREILSGQKEVSDKELLNLFLEDRANNQIWIQNSINNGYSVILDRYILSTMAYQGLIFPIKQLFQLNQSFFKPAIIFFLYCPVEEALKRKTEKLGCDKEKASIYEKEALQRQIYQNYLEGIDILKSHGYHIVWLDALKKPNELIYDIESYISQQQQRCY